MSVIRKYFSFEITLLLGLLAFLGFSITSQVKAQDNSGRMVATTIHYLNNDKYYDEAIKKTQQEANRFTDYILDYYGDSITTDKVLKIDVSKFINRNNTEDLSGLYTLIEAIPSNSGVSVDSAETIKQYFQSYHNAEYTRLIDSYDRLIEQNKFESLYKRTERNDIYSNSKTIGEKVLDTKNNLEIIDENNKLWTESTKTLDDRKKSFPKVPKTPAPVPTSVAHCLTMGIQASKNPTLKTIEEVKEPPEPLKLSDDYFIRQLLFLSMENDSGTEVKRDLRKALTKVLKASLDKELTDYYKEINKSISDKEYTIDEIQSQSLSLANGEKQITNDITDAFEFKTNLSFLKMRHNALEDILSQLLEVTDQIKQLNGIKKQDVSTDAKKGDAV